MRIQSLEQLQMFAQKLADKISPGDIVLLSGPLGVGKTTLTQLIAQCLGVTGAVTSPTYTYIHIHPFNTAENVALLAHIDLYRVESPQDFHSIGILELVNDPRVLSIIEWGEKFADLLPRHTLSIKITPKKDGAREIEAEPSLF